jgi:DNA-binding Lrp family transcriptional regulator
MALKTDRVQPEAGRGRALDRIDRRILGVLTGDASVSYADLGKLVGLSAPAAHERVKRLKATGVIRATVALVDPEAVGKPLLTFVHVDTDGWGKSQALMAICEHPEVEEVHSVAGDTCMLLKVRTGDTHDLEAILARLYATTGVKSTRSYVVLSTYLERPVQAGLTTDWPEVVPRTG